MLSGLRGRLVLFFVLFALVPLGVMGAISISQGQQGIIEAELVRADGIGHANADIIAAWVEARRNEVRYLATLDVFVSMDAEAAGNYLRELSDHNGYYDSLFLLRPDGMGVAGVERDHARGVSTIVSVQEAAAFQVGDRDWFQRTLLGNHAVTEVLISRATGNQIFSVASPVYRSGQLVVLPDRSKPLATCLATWLKGISGSNPLPSTAMMKWANWRKALIA